MKRFSYNGKEMTFHELLPLSAVPEKTLLGRLFSGNSLWSVESALNTPFGEKGKTPEVSVNESCKIEKKAKKNKPQRKMTIQRYEKETFYCVQCRRVKKINLLGRTFKANSKICTACAEEAEKVFSMDEKEIKAKDASKKSHMKTYKGNLTDKQLYFITGEVK